MWRIVQITKIKTNLQLRFRRHILDYKSPKLGKLIAFEILYFTLNWIKFF